MFRKLTAIEIAEGALLADIAIIFQLIAISIPVGKDIFRLLTPIVFAIIVLRRGLYAGSMSTVVAVFITGLISGPSALILMLLECTAGLFLGLTMKYRMRHFAILFLGTTSGALTLYGLIILLDLLTGVPLSDLILSLRLAYKQAIALVGLLTSSIGLGSWWQHSALPVVNSLANLTFTYWWLSFYLVTWIFTLPIVIVVYYITNFFMRLLGYSVRPFPGGKIEDLAHWILRNLIKLIPGGMRKRPLVRTLTREVRRLGIARQRAKL